MNIRLIYWAVLNSLLFSSYCFKMWHFLVPPPHMLIFHPNCQQYQTFILTQCSQCLSFINRDSSLIGYFSLYPQLHIQYLPQQNPILNIANRKSISFNFSHNDTMTMETIIIIIPSSIRHIENCCLSHRIETLCHRSDQPLFPFDSDFWILNHEAFCLYPFPGVHKYKY
jgi:hypothetical protein